jgi:hypothetical protein
MLPGLAFPNVRDLSVRPDPPRQQLLAQVKLVASYQKRASARPAPRPGRSPSGRTAASDMASGMPLASSFEHETNIH